MYISCRQIILALSLLLLGNNAFCYELILVRHFEKIAEAEDPGLTEEGHIKAKRLAEMLDNSCIAKIYSTDYNRTMQTAMPVSKRKELEIHNYDPRNLKSFANQLLANKQNALIVGHSNTTPELIKLLGGKAKVIEEKDYGEVFYINIDQGQVTQFSVEI